MRCQAAFVSEHSPCDYNGLMEKKEEILRENLAALMTGEMARTSFEDVVKSFPMDRINEPFPNADYTPYGLLEHIRLGQEDILDFVRNPDYKYKQWPKDYWPPKGKKATAAEWKRSVSGFKKDFEDLQAMIADPDRDLYAEVPWGEGETFLREIVTVCNHNAFHLGEFAIMRMAMGTWGTRSRV